MVVVLQAAAQREQGELIAKALVEQLVIAISREIAGPSERRMFGGVHGHSIAREIAHIYGMRLVYRARSVPIVPVAKSVPAELSSVSLESV